MFERLENIERTFEELNEQMADPSIISDQNLYTKVTRQHRELEPLVERFRALKKLDADLAGAREILAETGD
ncbi:MAG: PCRF domain-containing protein, partial [Acidobacteriota bacterium]